MYLQGWIKGYLYGSRRNRGRLLEKRERAWKEIMDRRLKDKIKRVPRGRQERMQEVENAELRKGEIDMITAEEQTMREEAYSGVAGYLGSSYPEVRIEVGVGFLDSSWVARF